MHAKDLLADLAEPGAVVAVTDFRKTHAIPTSQKLMLAGLTCFMVLSFQNCSVDLASTTPGASGLDCDITGQEATDFTAVLNNILQTNANLTSGRQGCGNCHGDSSVNVGKATFEIFQGNTMTDPTLITRNFCQVAALGAVVATHPQDATHGGGQYPASDLTALITFVNTYF